MKNLFCTIANKSKKMANYVGGVIYKRKLPLLKIGFWILLSLLTFYPHPAYWNMPHDTIEDDIEYYKLIKHTPSHSVTKDWRSKFSYQKGEFRCDSSLDGTYTIIAFDSLWIQQDTVDNVIPPRLYDSLRGTNIPFSIGQSYPNLDFWSKPLSICQASDLRSIYLKYANEISIDDARGLKLDNFNLNARILRLTNFTGEHCRIQISSDSFSMLSSFMFYSGLNLRSQTTSISHCNFRSSSLNGNIKYLNIYQSNLDSLELLSFTDSLTISNSILDGNTSISLGKYCKLSNIIGNSTIKLFENFDLDRKRKEFVNLNIGKDRKIEDFDTLFRTKVLLGNIDFNRLKFVPKSILFVVDTSSNQSYASQFALYKQIVEYYKDNKDERKIYDVQLQSLVNKHEGRWFIDLLEKNFNYYGYEPNRVWAFSGTVFLIFLIINNLLYPFILKNGYSIPDIENSYKPYSNFLRQFVFDLAHSFLYSLLIFWIFKIDLDKLKATNLWLTTLVVVEHVIALVLLAFIASTILNNPLVF